MISGVFPRLHTVHLPLKKAFGTGRWRITVRETAILELREPTGLTGYGECAPLEEFGAGNLPAARAALERFIENADYRAALALPLEQLPAFTASLQDVPTARYAVESALLDLRAKKEGVPLRVYLGGDESANALPVNAVISDCSVGQAEDAARIAADEGYKCIKLKAGARDIEEDIDRIVAVRMMAGNHAFVRLDINGAWSRKETEHALYLLEPHNIEYIEQPIDPSDRDGLLGIASESPIPIAADESIIRIEDAYAFLDSPVRVLIFKPMTIGSLIEMRDLARQAYEAKKKIICTSMLDSAIGRATAVHTVLSLPFGTDQYHGFATGNLFAKDVAPFMNISRSMLRVPDGNGIALSPNLDTKKR